MHSSEISEEAKAVAKSKEFRVLLISKFADPETYKPDAQPFSVYMAGSPGAGKTEFSKQLISSLESKFSTKIVRIDADEIRMLLPQYAGDNSWQVQGAAAIGVEKVYDFVLQNNQHVVLDGTLANFEKARDNIQRSIEKGRTQALFYLYQDPEIAWNFTKKRERVEGRNIPRDAFINSFLRSRENVERIKSEFGHAIQLNVVIQNYENDTSTVYTDIDSIDPYITKWYTREELEKIII